MWNSYLEMKYNMFVYLSSIHFIFIISICLPLCFFVLLSICVSFIIMLVNVFFLFLFLCFYSLFLFILSCLFFSTTHTFRISPTNFILTYMAEEFGWSSFLSSIFKAHCKNKYYFMWFDAHKQSHHNFLCNSNMLPVY